MFNTTGHVFFLLTMYRGLSFTSILCSSRKFSWLNAMELLTNGTILGYSLVGLSVNFIAITNNSAYYC